MGEGNRRWESKSEEHNTIEYEGRYYHREDYKSLSTGCEVWRESGKIDLVLYLLSVD